MEFLPGFLVDFDEMVVSLDLEVFQLDGDWDVVGVVFFLGFFGWGVEVFYVKLVYVMFEKRVKI